MVFDLDDTLYPERAYILSGFRAVAHWAEGQLGIPAVKGLGELRSLFEAGVRGDTFDRWLDAHGLAVDNLVPQLVQVYREHQPQITPFPEVPALLGSLRASTKLGLVSDGYLAVQQRKLDALGLEPSLDAVVFSDRWGRTAWKPSTLPFEAVLEAMHADPLRSVYVGDNPTKDFLGARQLGMTTIWIRRAGGEYAHLQPPTTEHAPDLTVPSLVDLTRVLAEVATSRP